VFRESRRNMHHALLMLRAIEAQSELICELDNALAESGHVAVAKNTPNTFNKPVLATITLHVLVRYELYQCLSNSKTDRFTHNDLVFTSGFRKKLE
jgi:hypothetical protein